MDNPAQPAEYLRLGVEAARAGQRETAQTHLNAILLTDPNNIPALFWLAYVAPSPQESLRLLNKVLALDPENERAKAGVKWANQRIQAVAPAPTVPASPVAAQTEVPIEETPLPTDTIESAPVITSETIETVPPETDTSPQNETAEMPDEFIKSELLSKEKMQKQAKKSALAHRARRNLNPLLVMVLLLGGAVALALGAGLSILTPTNTLAAWLPMATGNAPLQTEAITDLPASVSTVPTNESPVVKNFTSTSDTIIFNTPIPASVTNTESNVNASTADGLNVNDNEMVAEETTNLSVDKSPQVEIAPAELIGPTQDEPTELIEPEAQLADENTTTPEDTSVVTENPAVAGSINELVGDTDEVLAGPRLFEPVDEDLLAHQPASPNEKWIEIDVTLQKIVAWEGNTPVMSFIGSTGLPNTPTVLGEYNVYWKLEKTLMAGADYYLPDVPYTMYFYGGYAIHGTYWHDNFGQPMSHGCVNLTSDNAQQIFEWADPIIPAGQTQVVSTYENPGTLVVVHK